MRRRLPIPLIPFARGATLIVALVALTACQPIAVDNGAGGGSTGTGKAPTGANATRATADLHDLASAGQLSMAGYSRDRFHIWAQQGGDCDTRDVVLKRDGNGVKATTDCKITAGSWKSPYNGKTYGDPQQLEIDHIVPLANAWRSGAQNWSDDKRKQFANDLTRPELVAVDNHDNLSKGDQDPSQWKPPSQDFWCTYAEDWITVKAYWKLTVTSAEKSALTDMLGTCT